MLSTMVSHGCWLGSVAGVIFHSSCQGSAGFPHVQMLTLWACDIVYLCRSGVLSLGCTNNERIVFMGRWYTPTSCARNILASFSDVPWMYGRPMLVPARFGLSLSLGLALGISKAQSSYWLVLSARFTWASSRDWSSGFVTRTSALFSSVRTTERLCSM